MPLRIAAFHFSSDIAARHCHQRHHYHQRHQHVIKAEEAANAKLDARSQALAAAANAPESGYKIPLGDGTFFEVRANDKTVAAAALRYAEEAKLGTEERELAQITYAFATQLTKLAYRHHHPEKFGAAPSPTGLSLMETVTDTTVLSQVTNGCN